jgi:cytochrome c oxidase subunit 2
MWPNAPLFPQQASTIAPRVDAVFFFLVSVFVFFAALIFILVFVFAIKFRRRSVGAVLEPPVQIEGSNPLEILWSVIPLGIALTSFAWGAQVYFSAYRPPNETLEVYVVGKQWMWKLQHPGGKREINTLHVPVGQPVKLLLASEDVIHSFYIPAFRIKRDVLPGRYTTVWFEASRIGEYHLFCAEYCGTEHSLMRGQVIVMEPSAYQDWLSGGEKGVSLTAAGESRFQQLGCNTCHKAAPDARGPALAGLFGKTVELSNGQTVVADEAYLRESILKPNAKIVSGYKPLMPTYQGQINEEGVLQLIAYIKSLEGIGSGE